MTMTHDTSQSKPPQTVQIVCGCIQFINCEFYNYENMNKSLNNSRRERERESEPVHWPIVIEVDS